MNTTPVGLLIKRHLEVWNETDPERRRAAIAEIYSDEVEFIDPFTSQNGREKLDYFINDLQSKNPGFAFTPAGPVNAHHHIGSLFWHFGPADKPDAITGQDVFVVKDNCIQKLYAFIDDLEP